MRTTSSSEQIYLLHIPKTGGGSLKRIVTEQFGGEEIAPAMLMQDLARAVRAGQDLGSYPLVHGHFGHTLLSYVPPRPRVITMLREPVARTVSRFHWARVQREPSPAGDPHDANLTIDQYVDIEWAGRMLANFQTRNLALDFDLTRNHHDRDGNQIVPSQSQLLTHVATDLSDDELLERATQRLASFEFIGVTERFAESVQLMCHTFGWPEPPTPPHVHKAADAKLTADALPRATRAKIEGLTRLDAELHRFASDLFESRYASSFPADSSTVPR